MAIKYCRKRTYLNGPTANTKIFTYNGLDTRVGKVDSSGTHTFRRDGDYVTSPVLDDGFAKYTPGVSDRRGSSTRFTHPDRLGSVIRHTGSSQGVASAQQYDAWGNVAAASGTWAGPFGYAGNWGYQDDSDSGLKLLGHRYYDASTGRFLTRDPIKDGRNWYAYCDNNPLAAVDPAGLEPGQEYDSLDAAALDALKDCQTASDNDPGGGKDGFEYASNLIELKNGKFTYTKPERGNGTSATIVLLFDGYAHSHGRSKPRPKPAGKHPSEDFSPKDKLAGKQSKRPIFLIGPYGVSKRFDWVTGRVEIWNPVTQKWEKER